MQGKTINGFELKRLLGTGGMAEVWYAENEIHKAAAVKILNAELSNNGQIVERFRNEAEIMVKLNHPNIRQVYGYGSIDGRPAIIMEYLEGEDLKTKLKRGQRFKEAELECWWNQLVLALNYTHGKGIVHRDIKPGNIFVDTEGNIKLLDFGIAKVRESISSTQTGQKLGTLMYMSPEQVKDSKHIDYRTDIYSLAVTFVHLITGKRPYDSDTSSDFEISEQIVYKPLDLSELPMAWRNFLSPYLEKAAQNRPALRPFEMVAEPPVDDANDEMEETIGASTGSAAGGIGTSASKRMGTTSSPVSSLRGTKGSSEAVVGKTDLSATTDKPKNKKVLWISLGVAAAAVVALVVVLAKPKPALLYDEEPVEEEMVEIVGDGYEYVDLGLPSGTLWATCNVGASKPEGYGNYYAWGETNTKSTYNWFTYKYANGNYDKLTKYCNKSDYGSNGFTDKLTTLQSGDDPATANWGSGWQTPSKAQWDELLANTTNQWTTRNGVKGRLFTSKKNGLAVFFPAAGDRWGSELYSAGSYGYYWSRSLYTDYPGNAWYLYFDSDYCGMYYSGRYRGLSVRPVRSALQN